MDREKKLEIIKNQKFFIKNDIFVFIALAITVTLLFAAVFLFNNRTGAYACIYSEGRLIKTMPLDTDSEYLYEYEEHYNLIAVVDGYVFVKEADCEDRVCIAEGKINRIGDTIICLPHKLKIVIKGEGYEPADI